MQDHPDALELEQNLRLQRRGWRIQRIGWALMACIVLAALAGLLGSGPLSRTSKSADDGSVSLEYERFARYQAPTTLRVRFALDPASAAEVRLVVDRRFLERMKVEHVLPQPEKVELAGERLIYVFPAGQARSQAAVTFSLKPDALGLLEGAAGIEGRGQAAFRQFVYP